VVGQVDNLADLDAGRRLELVGGDDGTGARLDDVAADAEVLELLLERLRVGLELLARPLELRGGRRPEQADRRQLEGAGAALAEVEGLLPREPLLHERALELGGLLDDETGRLRGPLGLHGGIEPGSRRRGPRGARRFLAASEEAQDREPLAGGA